MSILSLQMVTPPVKVTAATPRGLCLYRGKSMIDGSPIVVVATGLDHSSENPKLGDFVQTWAFLDDPDYPPHKAARENLDRAVCGNCLLKPQDKESEAPCYVLLYQAPLAIFKAFYRGNYPSFQPRKHLKLFRGVNLRLGAYGNPSAMPLEVVLPILKVTRRTLGYEHCWRTCDPRWRWFCMASVHSPEEKTQANDQQWRTFRTKFQEDPVLPDEIECPASEAQGFRLTCEQCGACNGTHWRDYPDTRRNIVTNIHGRAAKVAAYRKRLGR